MKIKWIVLFALSIWAIGFCLVFYSASRQQTKLVDNGKINDVQMQMIKKYLSGEERPETCMGMDILWRNQKDYKEQVNDRIVRGQSMADIMVKDQLVGKVCWDADGVDVSTDQMGISYIIIVGFLLALFGILLLSYYFYRQLVLPFRSLQRFTEHVAMGDLDFPIKMEKKNYFGAFTTSFDIMRVELKRARDSESQALQSKRELVAQLSHDVKTPISSISANCELLLLQVSNGDERKKIEVIQRKTKMIEELTSSLFQAALEEINQLKEI